MQLLADALALIVAQPKYFIENLFSREFQDVRRRSPFREPYIHGDGVLDAEPDGGVARLGFRDTAPTVPSVLELDKRAKALHVCVQSNLNAPFDLATHVGRGLVTPHRATLLNI